MRAFDWKIFAEFYVKIIPYLRVTFTYTLLSVLLGTVLGAWIAVMKLSRFRILKVIGNLYTVVMRCVPSIVMLFLIYYGLPVFFQENFGLDIYNVNGLVFVICSFSLLLAAPISEIIRTSYLAVPKGQFEAGVMVGLSQKQVIQKIILPQGMKIAFPNFGNIFIFMMKEGALAYMIGIQDVLGRGYYLNGLKSNVFSMETYTALALIYWPCTIFLEKVFACIEKRGGMTDGH